MADRPGFRGGPGLVVCDEPISSLDVSVQGALLNLLADLQDEAGTSYLFISHDLAAVQHLSHRIGVMYLGTLMEQGEAARVLAPPYHPYTEALLSAIPVADPTVRDTTGAPARQARRASARDPVGVPLPSALPPLPRRSVSRPGAAVATSAVRAAEGHRPGCGGRRSRRRRRPRHLLPYPLRNELGRRLAVPQERARVPGFILRRLGFVVLTVLLSSMLVFGATHVLPGDVATMVLGREASQQAKDSLRKELGLDRPLVVQYGSWLGDMARGDWGTALAPAKTFAASRWRGCATPPCWPWSPSSCTSRWASSWG